MNADQDFDLTIPEPHATIMNGPARVGAELRAVRERLGWKLPDIAARLKIRLVFLEAIESGNLSALPAPAYAAGFIRSYSEAMGLDPEEILRRFRAEGMSRPRSPALTFPEPVPDRAVPPGAIVFLVAVIGIGAYFLWYRHSEHELKMAQMVPTVPAKLAPLAVPKSAGPKPSPAAAPVQPAPTPAAPAAVSTAGSSTMTADTAPTGSGMSGTTETSVPAATTTTGTGNATNAAATTPAAGVAPASNGTVASATNGSTQTDAAITPPVSSGTNGTTASIGPGAADGNATTAAAMSPASDNATNVPPPTTNTSAAPAVASAADASGSLVISASANSWIEVRDPHGAILFSRVLKAGESWPVPDEPGLTLTTGNAGGTELVRKGVAGPPLGKTGAVLHNVPLTPPAGGAGAAPAAGTAGQ